MRRVEVVVVNWKRPRNVARIVAALRTQTAPCTVTVCDCHPSPEFALDARTLAAVDRLYSWSRNYGSYNRYVPLGAYDHEFTLFLDDDLLPGVRCVEHFLRASERARPFGVLGQLGRILPADGAYNYEEVPRAESFVETDAIVRGYFVLTENLPHVARLRLLMGCPEESLTADDLLLCIALRICAGLPCYLTPLDADAETLINKRELPNAHAISSRPRHLAERIEFLRRAASLGWQPLNARGGDAAHAVSAGEGSGVRIWP